MDYYVYVFLRCDKIGSYNYGSLKFKYQPFYVGKGRNNRINISSKYGNPIKMSIIKYLNKNKIKMKKIKVYEGLTELESIQLEEKLINKIGIYLDGGILSNIVKGGQNPTNPNSYKSVCMFDEFGNFLKRFDSIEEVCLKTGLSQPNITKCCRGERYTTGGKIFKYSKEIKNNKKLDLNYLKNKKGKGPIKRKVLQYDMNWNLIKKWNSIKEASINTGCCSSKIVLCCQEKRNHTKNFKWRYL